jgi:hypothetical protein
MVDPIDITPQASTIHDTNALDATPLAPTTGLNMTFYTLQAADWTNGITFLNTGHEVVVVMSKSANVVTTTAQCAVACDQGFKSPQHDVIASQTAGSVTPTFKVIGQFQTSRYNQTIGAAQLPNRVLVTFAGDTGNVSIAVLQTPTVGQ